MHRGLSQNISLFNADTKDKINNDYFESHNETCQDGCFSPDSKELITCARDGTIYLW